MCGGCDGARLRPPNPCDSSPFERERATLSRDTNEAKRRWRRSGGCGSARTRPPSPRDRPPPLQIKRATVSHSEPRAVAAAARTRPSRKRHTAAHQNGSGPPERKRPKEGHFCRRPRRGPRRVRRRRRPTSAVTTTGESPGTAGRKPMNSRATGRALESGRGVAHKFGR